MNDNRIDEIIKESIDKLLISEGLFKATPLQQIKRIVKYLYSVQSSLNNIPLNTFSIIEDTIREYVNNLIIESALNERLYKGNKNQRQQNARQQNVRQQNLKNKRQQNLKNKGQQNQQQAQVQEPQQQQQAQAQEPQQQQMQEPQQEPQPQQQAQAQEPNDNNGYGYDNSSYDNNNDYDNNNGYGYDNNSYDDSNNGYGYDNNLSKEDAREAKQTVINTLGWGKQILKQTIVLLNEYLKLKGYNTDKNNVAEGKIYESGDGTMFNPMQLARQTLQAGRTGFNQGNRWGKNLLRYLLKNKERKQANVILIKQIDNNIKQYRMFYNKVTNKDEKNEKYFNYVYTNVNFGEEIRKDIESLTNDKTNNCYNTLNKLFSK